MSFVVLRTLFWRWLSRIPQSPMPAKLLQCLIADVRHVLSALLLLGLDLVVALVSLVPDILITATDRRDTYPSLISFALWCFSKLFDVVAEA